MPLDALTASRLARDGEKAGPVRHMCSGQHTVSILLSRLRGWDPTDYWKPGHPSQIAYRAAVAAVVRHAAGEPPDRGRRLRHRDLRVPAAREIARAFAMLADPAAIPAKDPRAALAPSLSTSATRCSPIPS